MPQPQRYKRNGIKPRRSRGETQRRVRALRSKAKRKKNAEHDLVERLRQLIRATFPPLEI